MRSRSIAVLGLAVCLVTAAVLAAACSPSSPDTQPGADDPSAASAADEDRYTVRGLVVEIPETAERAVLRIQHEAIPDFKGMDGKVWDGGMESMTMIFAVADGVSLDEISAGDRVEFVLVVDWAKKPTQAITEIVKLPAETELSFGPTAGDAH